MREVKMNVNLLLLSIKQASGIKIKIQKEELATIKQKARNPCRRMPAAPEH
jgi:hypothetical protein